MTSAMAAKTLAMLHALEDFENDCLQAEIDTKDRRTDSAEVDRSRLVEIRSQINSLRQSIRSYRAPKKATQIVGRCTTNGRCVCGMCDL